MKKIIIIFCLLFCSMAYAGETPDVKIIQEKLMEFKYKLYVVGTVYNPHNKALKNVIIEYEIWSEGKGNPAYPTMERESGGLTQALIMYLPPKASMPFKTGGNTAWAIEGKRPKPLKAKIMAEFDK